MARPPNHHSPRRNHAVQSAAPAPNVQAAVDEHFGQLVESDQDDNPPLLEVPQLDFRMPLAKPLRADVEPPLPSPGPPTSTPSKARVNIEPGANLQHSAPLEHLRDGLTVSHSAPSDTTAHPFSLDISKLAHELRTPIGAIVALSEVMRDERFGPLGNARYTGYANDIYQSATHALAVLSAMLEAQPGPDGRADPRGQMISEQLELNALARSCVSGLQPIAAKSGIHLRTALHPRPLKLSADRRSLKQIVLNVLSNSLKFTPAGGTVTVATSIETSETDLVGAGFFRLDVRDTGVGMPPTLIANLLGRVCDLSTVQTATDRPTESKTAGPLPTVGIGLPLARDLAEANGGRLSIKSDANGTTVSLHLPSILILSPADAQTTRPLGK